MADIKLQPTDRCVLDYGTTERLFSTNINKGMTLLSMGGIDSMLYKGSTTATFDGEVRNVTIYKNSSSPSDATFTYTISGNTVTFSCKYNAPSGSSSIPMSASVSATVTYIQTMENKQEVFQIKNNSGMILWNKCKPININFDTNMISSIQYDATDGYGGSQYEITKPGTYYIVTGDRLENIIVHPQDGYVVSSDDLTDAYNAGLLDLTDIANLTLGDFAALELYIEAEEETVETILIDPAYIANAANMLLIDGAISIEYREYLDWDSQEYSNIQEGGKAEDVFVAYDYLENNEGVVVPVLYKTDLSISASADKEDIFYYVGREALPDGNTYDKWRKIDTELDWDSAQQIYWYTNIITTSGAVTEPLLPIVLENWSSGYSDTMSAYNYRGTFTNPNPVAGTIKVVSQGGLVNMTVSIGANETKQSTTHSTIYNSGGPIDIEIDFTAEDGRTAPTAIYEVEIR